METGMSTQPNNSGEILNGVLRTIIWQSPKDDFLIAKFDHQDTRGGFTALGSIANPDIGMSYRLLNGQWIHNARYGKQFKFGWYTLNQPKGTDGIFRYLVRAAKWVGPTVGSRLIDTYGADTLKVMKTDPQRVADEIKGLTLERALEIQAGLKENEAMEGVVVELEQVFSMVPGLRKNLATELIKFYRADAAVKLRENPYILTRVHGVGFPTADQVALAMGFARDSEKRRVAAVRHILEINMAQEGNVWIDIDRLTAAVDHLVGGGGLDGVFRLEKKKRIVGVDGLYATCEADRDESEIAGKILALLSVRKEAPVEQPAI
jgi:exodeoxyribonuclease V alpha subunit